MRISDWSSDVCSSDLQLSIGAMHDPDRLAAPFDRNHLAGSDIRDVDFDRGARRTRFFRRRKGADEGNRRGDARGAADGTGGSYPETARWVWRQVGVNRAGIIKRCRNLTHSSIIIHALEGHTTH